MRCVLFCRDDHFGATTQSAEKFFAVLPAQSELSHICQAEPANNVCQNFSVGFVEIRVHHGALGPIYQFLLANFAMQVVSNLIGNDLAGDFHRLLRPSRGEK